VAVVAVRGLEAWRTLRRVQRRAELALAEVERRLRRLEELSAEAGDGSVQLNGSVASLQASVAETRVLVTAAQEVTRLTDRLRGLVPRK
jgi:uncharacterized coiled-coil protein SlyX